MRRKVPLTHNERQEMYRKKQNKMLELALGIIEFKIKGIYKFEKAFFMGLFVYEAIYLYTRKLQLNRHTVYLLLIIDQYHIFGKKDALSWGQGNSRNYNHMIANLRKLGYIEKVSEKGQGHSRQYYITVKGKALIREFYDFYTKRGKEVLTQKGHDKRTIGAFLRNKDKRSSKPYHKPSGAKFTGNFRRENSIDHRGE